MAFKIEFPFLFAKIILKAGKQHSIPEWRVSQEPIVFALFSTTTNLIQIMFVGF